MEKSSTMETVFVSHRKCGITVPFVHILTYLHIFCCFSFYIWFLFILVEEMCLSCNINWRWSWHSCFPMCASRFWHCSRRQFDLDWMDQVNYLHLFLRFFFFPFEFVGLGSNACKKFGSMRKSRRLEKGLMVLFTRLVTVWQMRL